ncbi:MAG: hypothetical protein IPH82_30035 [Chloroflexi bacterium]|nr:hypothetical protein [Chloroflexota bacterium]
MGGAIDSLAIFTPAKVVFGQGVQRGASVRGSERAEPAAILQIRGVTHVKTSEEVTLVKDRGLLQGGDE